MRTSILLVTCFLVASLPAAADTVIQEFSGHGRQATPVFRADGPWLVSWQARQPLTGVRNNQRFELFLHDADSGAYLGQLTQWVGAGNGDVLVERSGRFRLQVTGDMDRWQLTVRQITPDHARRLLRAREAAEMGDTEVAGIPRRDLGTLRAWRAFDPRTVVLESTAGARFRVTLDRECRGLMEAENLSLISGTTRPEFVGILLEDGTRCDFVRVLPDLLPMPAPR